jgi:hypothetical protein
MYKMGENRNECRIFFRSLKLGDNIKMYLKGIALVVMVWIYTAQHRVKWPVLVNTKMNLRVP